MRVSLTVSLRPFQRLCVERWSGELRDFSAAARALLALLADEELPERGIAVKRGGGRARFTGLEQRSASVDDAQVALLERWALAHGYATRSDAFRALASLVCQARPELCACGLAQEQESRIS